MAEAVHSLLGDKIPAEALEAVREVVGELQSAEQVSQEEAGRQERQAAGSSTETVETAKAASRAASTSVKAVATAAAATEHPATEPETRPQTSRRYQPHGVRVLMQAAVSEAEALVAGAIAEALSGTPVGETARGVAVSLQTAAKNAAAARDEPGEGDGSAQPQTWSPDEETVASAVEKVMEPLKQAAGELGNNIKSSLERLAHLDTRHEEAQRRVDALEQALALDGLDEQTREELLEELEAAATAAANAHGNLVRTQMLATGVDEATQLRVGAVLAEEEMSAGAEARLRATRARAPQAEQSKKGKHGPKASKSKGKKGSSGREKQ